MYDPMKCPETPVPFMSTSHVGPVGKYFMAECHIHDKPTMPCVGQVLQLLQLLHLLQLLQLLQLLHALQAPHVPIQVLERHCGLVVYMAFSHEVRALSGLLVRHFAISYPDPS